jgi:hypothetical protein
MLGNAGRWPALLCLVEAGHIAGECTVRGSRFPCRTRKDFFSLNLAIVRHKVFNTLKSEKSTRSLKRKRLKASVKPALMAALLAC